MHSIYDDPRDDISMRHRPGFPTCQASALICTASLIANVIKASSPRPGVKLSMNNLAGFRVLSAVGAASCCDEPRFSAEAARRLFPFIECIFTGAGY